MERDKAPEYDPEAERKRLGFDLILVEHEAIADFMAFYRVEYRGEIISPSIADRFDVGLNEIWMTERLRPYKKYIVYHELQEIKYRAAGYSGPEAHALALADERDVWSDEDDWQHLKREINLVTGEKFCEITGWSEKCYEKLVKKRPYFALEEVAKVPDIEPEDMAVVEEEFWCM